MRAVEIVFWLTVAFVAYTYVGYPLVLFVLSSLVQAERDLMFIFKRGERRQRGESPYLPPVTLGFAAYNEEAVMEQKLRNCLGLDYPAEKLEIIVASDGSDDATDSIVSRYAPRGVRLLADGQRRGKAARMNEIVAEATSPIVVLTDANTIYEPGALRALVRHFAEEDVGVVCGELRLAGPDGQLEGESLYWRYEVMLKFMENKLGLVVGSNGAIYALRRELFRPIPDETIVDDFVIPMLIRSAGYRIVYDPEAVAHEHTTGSLEGEAVRRRRIGAGNWQAAVMLRRMLNPLRGRVGFSFWSHKVFRWLVPAAMIVAAASSLIAATRPLYAVIFGVQVLFYAAAAVGHATGGRGPVGRWCSAPQVFVEMNLSLLWGMVRYLTGRQRVTWDRVQRARQLSHAQPVDEQDTETKELRAVDQPGRFDDTRQ